LITLPKEFIKCIGEEGNNNSITSYNSLIDWDKYIGINNNYLFASNKIERKRKKEKKS
jgi:hypothetical protein